MIAPKLYTRKQFDVEAIRVSTENMSEVAEWCLGTIKIQKRPAKRGEGAFVKEVPYLEVEVLRPLNDRQKMAFPGDWILKTGTSFKIYTDIAFRKNFFESKSEENDGPIPDPEDPEPAFRILKNGEWVPMTNDDLRTVLAPLIAESLQGLVEQEPEEEELGLHVFDGDPETPQVKLSMNPKTPE